MMGFGGGYNMMGFGTGVNSLLGLITWIAVLAVLVAAARYFWKKGDRK